MLRTLIAPLALFGLSLPAMAEKIPLADLNAYLNSVTTAEADFTQVNADGTISTGHLYLQRPGRVRFEYAPPDKSLVLASGGQVAIFDAKSNQPPEQYPLSRTPLSLILAKDVDFTRATSVIAHDEDGPATKVVVQDPEHPDYGRLELVFTPNPIELRQWVVTDDLGNPTTVILNAFKPDVTIPAALFSLTAEMEKRTP